MKREKSILGGVHLFLYLLSKNEYFRQHFSEMNNVKLRNSSNFTEE
ncbi:unnamed protein product [marine sediment metagenome]|uniref:Uncharacterized protein n=1 Tax=marine sediment metagenome TaxID=412755 RepID=X0YAH8_9ZZZZ